MNIFSQELIKIVKDRISKVDCIEEMVNLLHEQEIIDSGDEFFASVMEREKMMSTGIGRMIAIPHARHTAVREMKSVVFLLDKPIDFDALDNQLVKVVFLFAVPLYMGKDFVKIIGGISNFVRLEKNRELIFNCKHNEELFEILKRIKL